MQTKIYVDGMSCCHCEMSITKTISSIAGVDQVETDLQNRTVTVIHESASAEMIIAKIEEIGFKARV